jgi:hypothetical protein
MTKKKLARIMRQWMNLESHYRQEWLETTERLIGAIERLTAVPPGGREKTEEKRRGGSIRKDARAALRAMSRPHGR